VFGEVLIAKGEAPAERIGADRLADIATLAGHPKTAVQPQAMRYFMKVIDFWLVF
jgi:hypothetical protein